MTFTAVDVDARADAALAAVDALLDEHRRLYAPDRREAWRGNGRRWPFTALVWAFDRPGRHGDPRTGALVEERWLTPPEFAAGLARFEEITGRRIPVLFGHERGGVHRPTEFGLLTGWTVSTDCVVVAGFSVLRPTLGQPVSCGWVEHPADGLVVTELSLLGPGQRPGVDVAQVLTVDEEGGRCG